MEKNDLVQVLLQLVEPQQVQSLQFTELLGLLALVDLLGILNMVQPQAGEARSGSGRPLQDALQAVLQQKGKGGAGDLVGMLTKNPAVMKGLLGMLASMKEEPEAGPREEAGEDKAAADERLRLKNKR